MFVFQYKSAPQSSSVHHWLNKFVLREHKQGGITSFGYTDSLKQSKVLWETANQKGNQLLILHCLL